MDDHRFADNIPDMKFVGQKAHLRITAVRKQYGKISRMVAVGLISRIPMPVRGFERIGGIANLAYPVFMYMKAMGTDGLLSALRRFVGGQPAHIDADFRTGS